MSERCSEQIYNRFAFPSTVPCGRSGTLKECGKWWCKQHAPSSVAAHSATKERRRKQRLAQYSREGHALSLLSLAESLGIDDPESVAALEQWAAEYAPRTFEAAAVTGDFAGFNQREEF